MALFDSIDRCIAPLGKYLDEDYMRHLGIGVTQRLAKTYNRRRYRHTFQRNLEAAQNDLESLLQENRVATGEPDYERRVTIEDGYCFDRSGTLPFLDRLLDDCGKIIHPPGGRVHTDIQRPYFRNLVRWEDNTTYPAFFDFPLSSAVLEPVIDYMGMVPVLSRTRPPGIRLMESNKNLDDRIDPPLEMSQLFHIDAYDDPLIYVIVLAEDVTEECGPWSFVGKAASQRVEKALGYRKRGAAYRVPDEVMFDLVDKDELVVFTGKKGDVLFIETSACFHFGSRNAVMPRFLMMYGFSTPARTDFSMTYRPEYPYQIKEEDSRLRKLMIDPLQA